jgi:DNA transformation protein and related proteins
MDSCLGFRGISPTDPASGRPIVVSYRLPWLNRAIRRLSLDPDFISELFAPFRPVAVKRMFGGIGIYADGLMFGLAFDGVIYLRVDETSIPGFEREGSAPFVYPLAKNHPGRPSRHFWRLPERLYGDPDELALWAGRALAIAERRKGPPRARAKKKPTSKKRTSD